MPFFVRFPAWTCLGSATCLLADLGAAEPGSMGLLTLGVLTAVATVATVLAGCVFTASAALAASKRTEEALQKVLVEVAEIKATIAANNSNKYGGR